MKRSFYCVAVVFTMTLGLFFTAQAAYCQIGRVFEIDERGGDAFSTAIETPAFADAGVEGWKIQALVDSGVEFYIFEAEAESTFPAHKSPDEWIGYVLSGAVLLTLTDANGNQTSEIRLRRGDAMVFGADTMHGWKVGPVKTYILFVKPKAGN